MKTAIIHDIYLHFGGAERVLETLIEMYPQADIFISLIDKKFKKKIQKKTSGEIYSAPFNFLPFKKKYSSFLKPLVFLYWESLNLSKYNLVISSSHSFSAKSVKTLSKTTHISYIYTPPRYLYNEFNEMNWIKKKPLKFIFKPIINWLKHKDIEGSKQPDIIITDSKTVKKRIKKYYNRNSTVIYPPVKIEEDFYKNKQTKNKKYYLFHARLSKQKGCELAIKTCNALKKKLVIIGTGTEEKKLKKLAGQTISFKGFVPNKQITKIYSQAIALIAPYKEEDFGLTPIESMSYGVPVIALNSGGLKETINNKNGVLFDKYSIKSLSQAIKKFESKKISSLYCRNYAKQFSEKRFKLKFENIIETHKINDT